MRKISLHDIRLENMLAVFREIALGDKVTKKEIALATSLSLVTVGKITSALYYGGILQKRTEKRGDLGRPAEVFKLRTDAAVPIFDLSARTFRFALYTPAGEPIDEVRYAFPADPQFCPSAFVRFLQLTLRFLRDNHKQLRVLGVGVVISGVYDEENDRILSTMLPELRAVKPLQNIKKIFKTDNIFVENAARLSAESVFSSVEDRESKTLCAISVNDGVEVAAAEGGRFLRGASGLAGRLGDLPYGSVGTVADHIAGAADADAIEDVLLFLLKTATLAYDPDILFLLSSRFYLNEAQKDRLTSRLHAGLLWANKKPALAVCNTDLAERRQALCLRILNNWLLRHTEVCE